MSKHCIVEEDTYRQLLKLVLGECRVMCLKRREFRCENRVMGKISVVFNKDKAQTGFNGVGDDSTFRS